MNTPNKLTIMRICLVPFMVLFLLADWIPLHYLWALILFVAASITDAIDGHLARKHHLITDFGKFLDPLADKILVISALICFVQMGACNAVVVIVVIAREFLVSALRLVAVGGGKVIAASYWGKLKTVSQMLAIIYELIFWSLTSILGNAMSGVWFGWGHGIGEVLLWISTLLTVISGIDYIWKNRAFIDTTR